MKKCVIFECKCEEYSRILLILLIKNPLVKIPAIFNDKLITISSGHLARECDRRRERTNEEQVSLDLTVHTKCDTDSHVIIRFAVLGSSK